MSAVEELIFDVKAAGLILRPDPPDLVVKPEDRLTPELETRLREHKAEILRRFELEASISMQRLEAAGICIAVWEDGSMRVVITKAETVQAIDDGGTIYSPADMYHYLQLEPHERRTLHEFKKRFGGTVEWRPAR
jgi:hypothetical protein